MPRQDGNDTRAQLLETAGVLFAERGYAGTSSKDICEAAKVNLAAVNYHFGSRDGLYGAVLVEAHRQIVSLEALTAFAVGAGTPRDKLRAIMSHFIGLAALGRNSWGFRVMMREVMMPSPLASQLVEQAIKPKATVLKGLVAAVLALPPEHPAVQRGAMLTLLPCLGLVLAPAVVVSEVAPALNPGAPELAADIVCYAFAGLDALAAAHRIKKKPRRGA